jgi:hypothetical protein
MKNSIKTVLIIGVIGLGFSGYLSYGELFGECASGCPVVGGAGTVFGLPACVIGFFMYLAIVAVCLVGLRKK